MSVQPYVKSEDGIIFDISFNDGSVSFEIIDYTKEEIQELFNDIITQIELLEESYKKANENVG